MEDWNCHTGLNPPISVQYEKGVGHDSLMARTFDLDPICYGCIGQRNVPALYCIVTSPAAAAARTAASEVSR